MPTQLDNPVLPLWFRGGLIAAVMLAFCSCQAPLALVADESDTTLRLVANERREGSAPPTLQSVAKAVDGIDASGADKGSPIAAGEPELAAHFEAIQPSTPLPSPSDADPAPAPPAERVALNCPIGGGKNSGCETRTCEVGSCDSSSCDGGSGEAGSCDTGGCENGSCPTAGCDSGGCPIGGRCLAPYTGPGPRDEYLCDGGDCGPRVGVRPDWTIDGLEQEDTIAHYDTLSGEVCVEPSNKVCIYAPRFGAVRRVVNASQSVQRELINVLEDDAKLALADGADLAATSLQQLPPVTKIGELPPSLLLNRQQPGEVEARVVVRELKNLIKPYCNLQIVKLGLLDNGEKPWLAKATVAANTWTGDQAAQVTIDTKAASVLVGSTAPGVMYADARGKPCLRLVKLASTDHAQPGDEVAFTLRFDNTGAQEIGNVTIVDNLTTRLAYVEDSAESSVDADFSTSRNGAGSLILRWEITEPLKPGEGGVLQFRVRVR